jgi:hypothetical protein
VTRSMYDAADANLAPPGADLYAGYVDGNYQSYHQLRARFPGKLVIPIAVFPSTNDGIIFDGPPDNSTWDRVVDWVVMRRRAGVDPTVYTDSDQWATGVQEFNARGVVPPHWWIANWNGQPNIPAGAVGHQYANIGERYDISIVADHWPGVDPAPAPPPPPPVTHPAPPPPKPVPPPVPVEDEEMIMLAVAKSGTNDPGIWLLSGSLYAHVTEIASASALLGAGVKQANITYEQHQGLLAASAALQGKLTGSLNVSGALTAS